MRVFSRNSHPIFIRIDKAKNSYLGMFQRYFGPKPMAKRAVPFPSVIWTLRSGIEPLNKLIDKIPGDNVIVWLLTIFLT